MTNELAKAYREKRLLLKISAKYALAEAKAEIAEKARPQFSIPDPGGRSTIGIEGGFKLILHVAYDEFAEMSEGTWISSRDKRAYKAAKSIKADVIEVTREMHNAWSNTRTSYDRAYRIFVPSNTYSEHYKGLRKTHRAHDADVLARSYVIQDLRYCMSDEREQYIVTVCASRAGVELGSASLCGVDTGNKRGDYDRYIHEVARDLIGEAVAEAQSAVGKIATPETEEEG